MIEIKHKTTGEVLHTVYADTLAGSKKFKRQAKAALRYKELPYPKGETKRTFFGKADESDGVLFQ